MDEKVTGQKPAFDHMNGGKSLKLWMKKKYKKVLMRLLRPYEAEQDQKTKRDIEALRGEMENELRKLRRETNSVKAESQEAAGNLARELVKVKWKEIDRSCKETERPDDLLTCKICGHTEERQKLKTMVSQCQFNGGRLVRYICPQCGAIFGPTKFSSLSQQEIDDDYLIHYYGFDEANLQWKEEEAFFMLNPAKEKLYLDYGCGRWSKTVMKLRNMGYQVYGYEPYAPENGNPYIITDWDELRHYRFDGIFSNDLLEHLLDPVESLKQMKLLLKDSRGKMAHSTSCYAYRYEITRFHTFFFTGNSVEVLARRAGLTILDHRDALEERDFICYVYGMEEQEVNYMADLYVPEYGCRENGCIILRQKGFVCGPYINVSAGEYRLRVQVDSGMDLLSDIRVTSDKGQKVIMEKPLQRGENLVTFVLDQTEEMVEFVILNELDGELVVSEVSLI